MLLLYIFESSISRARLGVLTKDDPFEIIAGLSKSGVLLVFKATVYFPTLFHDPSFGLRLWFSLNIGISAGYKTFSSLFNGTLFRCDLSVSSIAARQYPAPGECCLDF